MAVKPRRIRLSRARGWRLPAGAVNVARPGRWGNLFRVGWDGTADGCVKLFGALCSGYICLGSKAGMRAQLRFLRVTLKEVRSGRCSLQNLLSDLEALRGKDLACWCSLDRPCHADVLLALANRQESPHA